MIVADIADEIYRELEPETASIPSIAFWLLSNLGRLNIALNESFANVASEISPELNEAQKDIFKKLYEIYYYGKLARTNLGAAAYESFSEVSEDGRKFKRTNKTGIAESYKALADGAKNELRGMIGAYRMNAASPVQIEVPSPIITEDTQPANGIGIARTYYI